MVKWLDHLREEISMCQEDLGKNKPAQRFRPFSVPDGPKSKSAQNPFNSPVVEKNLKKGLGFAAAFIAISGFYLSYVKIRHSI